MKRMLFAAVLVACLSAWAQSSTPAKAEPVFSAGTPDARAREALLRLNPRSKVDQIGAAPIPGFREAIVSGRVVYISDDGKYVLHGTLYDVQSKEDLGEESLDRMRARLLKGIPAADRIVFAPPNPRYTVAIFTDVECSFCRKLHSEIAEYNRQGIAVEYLAYPRSGVGVASFKTLASVWCAADRKKALTDAKNDRPVPARNCRNPVAMHHDLGKRMGLTGTPMLIARDGTRLGGYLTPAKLRAALDALAADGRPATKADAAVLR